MKFRSQVVYFLLCCCLISGSSRAEKNQISVVLLNGMFPGHLFPLVGLGEQLVKRGHKVTLCSTVLEGSKLLPDVPESVGITFVSAGADYFSWSDYVGIMKQMQDYFNKPAMNRVSLSNALAAIKIRDKLESIGLDNFDLIVCDISVLPVGLYYSILGKRVIVYNSFLPFSPAIYPPWPFPMTTFGSQTSNINFLDRLINYISYLPLARYMDSLLAEATEVDKGFHKVISGGIKGRLWQYPGVHIPHIITSVIGMDVPTLLSPLRHYVGPVLRESTQNFDTSLTSWLDGKKERSVLYISMGTTGDVSKTRAKVFIDAIYATGYDAVWTLREDSVGALQGLDIDKERVLIQNWVPQQALLKQKAIKACILHCGLNGVQESLYNGLPVVCLPHVFDQFQVGSAIEENKVGVSMYTIYNAIFGKTNFSSEDLTEAVHKVTSDEYVANAKRMSMIYKFAGGAKTAADLVEFYQDVGYDHLIPAFAKYQWSWIQYYNVDVYTLLLSVCGLLVVVLFKCCVRVCRTLTGRIFRG